MPNCDKVQPHIAQRRGGDRSYCDDVLKMKYFQQVAQQLLAALGLMLARFAVGARGIGFVWMKRECVPDDRLNSLRVGELPRLRRGRRG